MHRVREISVKSLLAAATLGLAMPVVQAVPVTSLYVVLVPAADPVQAAQEAMRVELVRLTGTRAAASDPALEPLIDNARQYVQLERSTTSGQVQVLFDEPALSAAIGAAGRGLWGADRPLLWIGLPLEDPATAATLRAGLTAAAQERGLPIMIVTADATASTAAAAASPAAGGPPTAAAPAATAPAVAAPLTPNATARAGAASSDSAAVSTAPAPPVVARSAAVPPSVAASAAPRAVAPRAAPAAAGPTSGTSGASAPVLTPQQALDLARSAGASAALIAQPSAANGPTPAGLHWTLVAADTGGQWVGGPELAIDNATDMLSSAARALGEAPLAQYDCQIVGVADLAGLVNVLSAVRSAPGVDDVAVSDVSGDALTLHVQARGSGAQVERALTSERLQPTGPGSNGLLEYRYLATP
jgi:hypothetical protein